MTQSHRSRRAPLAASLAATLALALACGTEPGGEPPAAAGTPASAPAPASDPAAVLELGSETFTFAQAECDLADSRGDGMVLTSRGTAPDGRRMTLEVERLARGQMTHERVTIYFGGIMEGDQWHARASGQPGGAWSTPGPGASPLDGPLIVESAGGFEAAGTFMHETRDEAQSGTLRVRCGV